MVIKVEITIGGDIKEFQGLSTDIKPTNCGAGSSFYELDTIKFWTFDPNNINQVTNNNWWGL